MTRERFRHPQWFHVLAPATAGCTLLASCAASPFEAESFPSPRPLGREHRAVRAPSDPAQPPFESLVIEPQVLSLGDAAALALLHNPSLAAFAFDVREAEARALQASLRPNPEGSVEIENFPRTTPWLGAGEAEVTIGIAQLFETAGKRRKRTDLALAHGRLAGWDYEENRIEIVTEVARRFIEALTGERRLALERENLELSRRGLDLVDRRIEAGAASELDRFSIATEVAMRQIAVDRAQRRLAASHRRLAAMWGSAQPAFERLAGDLDLVRDVPAEEVLAARISGHPRLARWDEERKAREAALELARAQASMDLTAGAGLRYIGDGSDLAMVFDVGMPIPLFDRNQGGILEARLALARAQHEMEADRIELLTDLATAYHALAAAAAEIDALRTQVLPNADRGFQAAQEALRLGKSTALNVLDAQRTLVDARTQLLDALAEYHSAVVEIEGLTATPIDFTPADTIEGGDADPSPEETQQGVPE